MEGSPRIIISLEDLEPSGGGYVVKSNGRIGDTFPIREIQILSPHCYALWFWHERFINPQFMEVVAIGDREDVFLYTYRVARGRATEFINTMGSEGRLFIDNSSRAEKSGLPRILDNHGRQIAGPEAERIKELSLKYKEHPASI